ncbi:MULTISPECIES: hypothetical protein [Bradyrhizobium]|uniref:Uncharacterized protein n=2 Tax=Bradyrhizobium TaxID=374 RepID=A0ABY0P886_9BRAD|nr:MULTISPECIES: hypothetical protein [Bradyrhizobium]SDH58174.1 hypothetical protein SAMN05444163_0457 [Bradyrhizobium ottawaense]SEE22413.1 hypothetical protein SAMN05444171_6711 [Bradyrhizobium lablabi]
MTVVAVWYEPHDDMAWIVADTKVSYPNVGGSITDSASKIFPLTIACHTPGPGGDFTNLVHANRLGFCFVGSTLPALLTYSVANTCFQTLIAPPNAQPPALEDVGAALRSIAERYLRETELAFECAVVGWCVREERYVAFHIGPDHTQVPPRMFLARSELYTEGSYLLLGKHKQQVAQRIDGVFAELAGQVLKRAPKLALQRIIQEEAFNDVGGSLQFGTAHRRGFLLKFWMRPAIHGEPAVESTFLGINVDAEIGQIGQFKIGAVSTI